MTFYIGIDPGSNYTGFAVHDGTKWRKHREYADPVDLWLDIEGLSFCEDLIVIIEDFTGQGRLNVHRKKTLEALGYLRYRCRESGIPVVIQLQQRRLGYVAVVPPEISGKDERSAAAHVLRYLVKNRIIRVPDNERVHVQRRTPSSRTPRDASVRKGTRS